MHRALRISLAAAALAVVLPVKFGHAAGPWVQQGWWKLNETGGNALVDSTANHNTGTAYGPTVDTGCNGGSNCRYFDGVNDFADIPWSAKTQPGTKNFRAVVTVWPTGPKPAHGDDLFRSSGYPNPFWKMEYNDPNTDGSQPNLGRLNCSFRGTLGQSYVAGGPDLSLGSGHTVECRLLHSAGAGGKDRTELWVDGSRRTYIDTNVGTISAGVSTIVGAHCCEDAGYFNGWLDDLKIYTATP